MADAGRLAGKQLKRLCRREGRLLRPKPPSLLARKTAPAADALKELVPEKAADTFRAAFEKGFLLVLKKGAPLIERSLNREKLEAEHAAGLDTLRRKPTRAALRRFHSAAGRSVLAVQGISAAEGTLLGALGVGLPDIPLFLGVILRTVYAVALRYGCDCARETEQLFALRIICAAAAVGEARVTASALADRIGCEIDLGAVCETGMEESVREASDLLAGKLAVVKMVQGVPLIGMVGGVSNSLFIGQVGRMARTKYQKRFLRRIQAENQA